ncbi:hypothetical protein BDR04DRAFT_1106341 [Suillus decipiens]|nr:hypothetical protein BDR04DRAFT_1106341 [Suillus decipiens]
MTLLSQADLRWQSAGIANHHDLKSVFLLSPSDLFDPTSYPHKQCVSPLSSLL